MVRDGYYYGFVMLAAAGLVAWLTSPVWAVFPVILAAFFVWFFRDPARAIPNEPGALVSPADGKVTDVSPVTVDGKPYKRISIFLNVFDVHVNRSPIAGVIRGAKYQAGKFLNAMDPQCADCNEQNTVTVEGEGHTIIFKQVARAYWLSWGNPHPTKTALDGAPSLWGRVRSTSNTGDADARRNPVLETEERS